MINKRNKPMTIPRGQHSPMESNHSDQPLADDIQDGSSETGNVPNGAHAGAAKDYAAGDLIRKRKRHRKKKKKLKIVLIALAGLLVLGGGTAFAVTTLINQGQQNIRQANEKAQVDTGAGAVTHDEGKTISYNGHTYRLKDSIVSVAIIGFDREAPAEEGEKAGQSDALMVMALDSETGKVNIISIPRDSMVLVDQYTDGTFIGAQTQQICLAYSYGDGGASSAEMTTKAISRTLYNIPIPYYTAMDLSGIGPLNDAIGGVSLTPLETIPGTNIAEGQDTVLLGWNARRYVQYRDTNVEGSALDRQQRQIQYVQAFSSQALAQAKGNAGTLVDLYNVASEYVITNLGAAEFSYLATCVASNGVTDVSMATLPGVNTQGAEHEEFQLDSTGVYEEVLNVYYQRID